MNILNTLYLPSTIIIVVLGSTVGLISSARAGEVITVNGHTLDSRTLIFTTPRPGANSRSSSILTVTETPSPGGFWKTQKQWKAYWVKDWAVKKVYVPVWKRVWGPTEAREWIPTGVAKPHPGTKHAPIIHRS